MTAPRRNTGELVVINDNLKLVHLRDDGVDVRFFGNLQSRARLSKAVLAHYVDVDPTTVDN